MRAKKIKHPFPHLQGRKYIVTGANSGIGLAASKHLVADGAHVVMACRSQTKAGQAIDEIKEDYPEAKLSYLAFDQADFAKIDEFVLALKKSHSDFDGFVFNAGIYHPAKDAVTKQGFPLTTGTNYLGVYYLLTRLLEHGVLDNGKKIRLVFVGSFVWKSRYLQYLPGILDDATKGVQFQYYVSKTAIGTLAYALSHGYQLRKDLPLPTQVSVHLMHPGLTATNIVNSNRKSFPKWFVRLANYTLTLFTHGNEVASLAIPYILGTAQPIEKAVVVPRGLFAISGYPKAIPYPTALEKKPRQLLAATLQLLKPYL
ncbi:MAG: SDR family NAD(P)-dependent oxidoreductase [Bacilli bacterium]|jgi:NAD(P)-dependent dehydrogenase (short-subunit alcohol dehydrogenase family)